MTYEIQYKIKMGPSLLYEYHSDEVYASIKYRPAGRKKWNRASFTLCSYELESMQDFCEKILGPLYGGSMDAYIQAMVEGLVNSAREDNERAIEYDKSMQAMEARFFTHGWKTMIAEIPDNTQEE